MKFHEPLKLGLDRTVHAQASMLNKKKSENALTKIRTQARSDMQLKPNHSAKHAR